jgi:hypothetical protein
MLLTCTEIVWPVPATGPDPSREPCPLAGRIASRRDGSVPARCPPGATDVIAGGEQAARPASHPIKARGNQVNHHASAQSKRAPPPTKTALPPAAC